MFLPLNFCNQCWSSIVEYVVTGRRAPAIIKGIRNSFSQWNLSMKTSRSIDKHHNITQRYRPELHDNDECFEHKQVNQLTLLRSLEVHYYILLFFSGILIRKEDSFVNKTLRDSNLFNTKGKSRIRKKNCRCNHDSGGKQLQRVKSVLIRWNYC